MNLEELADSIVRRGEELGATDTAAIVSRLRRRMLRFSNNSITVVQNWNATTPIVYMVLQRRRVASLIDEPNLETIFATMTELIKIAKIISPGDVEARIPAGPFSYRPALNIHDPNIDQMGNVDAIEASTNGALSENADRLSGVLVTGEWQRCVKTSAGGDGRDKGTYIELTVRAFAGDSSGQGNSCSTTLANFHPEEAGREAARIANLARNPKEGKEGKYTVVFGPPAMANLLNTCGDAASAYSVDAGFSYLAGKVGQKVASENITLSDDGTYPGGLSSASCDDEGFPTRRTKLMEKGVLKTYLHSSYTAEKFKAHLTGNGFYSGGIGGIIPIPTNLIVDSGAYSKDELLREVRRGLYVTNNWYTRFHNYQTGDFSTICRDAIFTIENGEISGSVKGLRVSENMLHIMQSTRGLSKERVWIKWWEVDTPVLLPHFMIDEVQLTKAT